jgi:hypothetical protein
MSTIMSKGSISAAWSAVQSSDEALDVASSAFGIAAAVTIVFNTVLAWIKDAYDPLNSFMASLTGHHWTTHGLADIAVFLILGWILMARHVRLSGTTLAAALAAAIVLGGGGLAVWFFVT